MRTHATLIVLFAVAAASVPTSVEAQRGRGDDVVAAYFRAVGDHFRVPASEVRMLAEGRLPADHAPVVLFIARRAGVSADALLALHRGGAGWAALARRYGVDASAVHIPLPEGAALGSLERVYERYQAVPRAQWNGIALEDGELAALINLGFLSGVLGVPASRVLEAWTETGSFPAAYKSLLGEAGEA